MLWPRDVCEDKLRPLIHATRAHTSYSWGEILPVIHTQPTPPRFPSLTLIYRVLQSTRGDGGTRLGSDNGVSWGIWVNAQNGYSAPVCSGSMGTNDNQEIELYHPDSDRELSTAIVETVADLKGTGGTETAFQLYDNIDPDALNKLFREDANPNTTVAFDTDDVIVTLWGDGTVKIKVISQPTDR